MRRIDALRTLALSAALILALGGTCGTSEEDTSDTSEPPSVKMFPPGVKVFPPVKVTSPPELPWEYGDPYPEEYVDPYPGVDWDALGDALGPVDTQMQPVGETFE
ncbi:MAG: hypothetical protein IH892_14770 [Planctomycetes bacterium]|nr:hypothetical protein [Planctomycetota bacterium]